MILKKYKETKIKKKQSNRSLKKEKKRRKFTTRKKAHKRRRGQHNVKGKTQQMRQQGGSPTQSILDIFISDFVEQVHQIVNIKNVTLTKVPFVPNNEDKEIFKFPFVPKDIVQEYEKKTVKTRSQYVVSNGKLTLTLRCLDNCPEYTTKNALLNLFCRFAAVSLLQGPKYNSVTVTFFPGTFKKEIPKQDNSNQDSVIFRPDNVNSGCAYHGNSHSIFIFRKEEFPKVFVHEMIHALDRDSPNCSDKLSNGVCQWTSLEKELLKKFHVQVRTPRNRDKLLLFETYTETWATIINAVLYWSHETGKCPDENVVQDQKVSFHQNDGLSFNKKNIMQNINNEINWARHQVAKILKVAGFNSMNGFLNQPKNKVSSQKLVQETGVFEYYILRAGILHVLESFLKCSYFDEECSKKDKAENSVALSVQVLLNDKKFQNMVSEEIGKIDLNADKSMRMTYTSC